MSLFPFSGRAFPLEFHSLGLSPFAVYRLISGYARSGMAINNGANAQVDNSLSAAGVRRMKRQARTSIPERLGRWTGRVWRGYVRREARLCAWFQDKGLPVLLTKTLLWVVKLTLLGVLLYAMFWVALIFLLALIAAWTVRNPPPPSERGEWRHGNEGHGYYRDGRRVDYGRLFEQDE
ncbi:DUF3742 family protein [Pseudomonas sp. EA_65y_Pfl1_P120]|uniref:DUF3742 family protein n=1 Tax=Pseudomonas sp. EA_65y_Pfl1_P120 TaxID=3088693 RepID=UPI0030DC97F5